MGRPTFNRTAALVIAAMLGAWLLSVAVAGATAIDAAFPSFSSTNVGSFQVNGSAYQTGSILRLTDNVNSRAGSAFWKNKVSLANDRSFSSHFSFKVYQTTSWDKADGLTFCIQPNTSAALSSGGGLGYSGIPNSVAIEFDTFNNGSWCDDPNNNHVGLNVGGSMFSLKTAIPSYEMYDYSGSTINYAWVDYNGTTDTLEVRLSNTITRPAAALISYSIDLSDSKYGLPEDVYVGFTAATGGANEYHDILSWFFNSDYISGGIDTAADTYEMGAASIASSASPATIEVGETSTVTFTVTDALGQPLPNEAVSYSAPSGGSTSAVSGSTDSQGKCSVTFTAPQVSGTYSVRGVVGALVAAQSITVSPSSAPAVSGGSYIVSEDAPIGATVGSAGVSDPKGLSTTCVITAGNDGGYFSVTSGGDVKVAKALPSVADQDEYHLAVQATNSAGKAGSGTVTVNVKNLSPGGGVDGENAGVSVRFDQVEAWGSVYIHPISPRQLPPPNHSILSGSYYDITTDAPYTGGVTVTLPYDPSQVRHTEALRVLHFHGGSCEVLIPAVDTNAHTVSARVDSFSDFAVGYDLTSSGFLDVPAQSAASLAALATLGLATIVATGVSRRRRRA